LTLDGEKSSLIKPIAVPHISCPVCIGTPHQARPFTVHPLPVTNPKRRAIPWLVRLSANPKSAPKPSLERKTWEMCKNSCKKIR